MRFSDSESDGASEPEDGGEAERRRERRRRRERSQRRPSGNSEADKARESLRTLRELYEQGMIDDEDFERGKRRVLSDLTATPLRRGVVNEFIALCPPAIRDLPVCRALGNPRDRLALAWLTILLLVFFFCVSSLGVLNYGTTHQGASAVLQALTLVLHSVFGTRVLQSHRSPFVMGLFLGSVVALGLLLVAIAVHYRGINDSDGGGFVSAEVGSLCGFFLAGAYLIFALLMHGYLPEVLPQSYTMLPEDTQSETAGLLEEEVLGVAAAEEEEAAAAAPDSGGRVVVEL